ncbi:hypothetical protein GLAREA_06120 [Glarea lozoyensis ATCC 20868]|uniref:Uncharacterized protein n=1 Tax=Glarea lozoyensis (strain ATCC 20868 / MF5171) TaxID=1116229 RepID=S3E3T4_GLAL2|nr:uncharacterized protein GLAREA_06120 [Glarea lozoyensis ATCC 20868]EPE33108.1 hypothetical protein GLAREA_06120 [Glarea lozoyensis ATCC 20868]
MTAHRSKIVEIFTGTTQVTSTTWTRTKNEAEKYNWGSHANNQRSYSRMGLNEKDTAAQEDVLSQEKNNQAEALRLSRQGELTGIQVLKTRTAHERIEKEFE